jgi:hypothetical protein
MWVLFARAPPPDAPYWPGRRWLAAIDALAWPGAAWCALSQWAGAGGIVFALVGSLLTVSAARRLLTALFDNPRYRFTTWRWGRVLLGIAAVGLLLKVALSV